MWKFNFAGIFDIFRVTKYVKVILLQSATNCYYKVRQVLQSVTDCYYKVRQGLQSVTGYYYKVRQILQSATVITKWDVAEREWER